MNIKYFFEDKESSALSKLFRIIYKGREDIVFVNGSGNLCKPVSKHLQSSDSLAYVYLDTVPNNLATLAVYTQLKQLSIDTDYRCVVIPIICAEYYYLKSLGLSTVIKHTGAVQLCLTKRYYLDSEYLEKRSEGSYKTFERFCKMLCEYALYRCASINRRGALKPTHTYTTEKCPCSTKDAPCVETGKSLEEKAKLFVSEFPCIPRNEFVERRAVAWDTAWEDHRRLIEGFNAWSRLYSLERPDETFLVLTAIH